MQGGRVKAFTPQPGQMIGLMLIGILLLSGLLYYRAVKAQRYLEPTLAIAQPRIEFAQNVRELIAEEFGARQVRGMAIGSNSVFIEDSLLFTDPQKREVTDARFMEKLSRIFLSILNDPRMRPQFDLILIGTSLPVSPHPGMNRVKRVEMQQIAENILDSLYTAEPELKDKYRSYFAATAVPVQLTKSDKWVEFRIIPSEHLHTEMIRSLEKYYF